MMDASWTRQDAFAARVTSEEDLRALLGWPGELVRRKVLLALDEHCRAFIARSPFLLISSADAAGVCDVSPRGDAPGFVLALDETRLIIPERPGNRRMDTLRNILQNPRVGLLFAIPGMGETLRVNGRACVFRDPDVLARLAARGRVCEKSTGPTGSAGVSPVPAPAARTPGRARRPRSQDFSQTLPRGVRHL